MDWTINTALKWTQEHFARRGEENPRLVAQILLAAATGLSRLELYLDYQRPLSVDERAQLREMIQRRDLGEPLQYLTGKAAFRYLELVVRPGVLIPRPETETLVELVLEYLAEAVQGQDADAADTHPSTLAKVLEMGTGSGCIALSLLEENPYCTVLATDISVEALEQAWINAQACLSETSLDRLTLIQDDLASSLLNDQKQRASFDVIVSNPPYIPTAELATLPPEVAEHEPWLALDGGADGLDVFRRILEQATQLLKSGGLLACELHQDNLQVAAQLARAAGFIQIQVHHDLTGRQRFLSGRWAEA